MAAHSMYFPKSQFQLGSPLILVTAPAFLATPTSEYHGRQKPSCCVFLLLSNLQVGPPWNEGHRPKARHETSVLEVRAQGTTLTQFLL